MHLLAEKYDADCSHMKKSGRGCRAYLSIAEPEAAADWIKKSRASLERRAAHSFAQAARTLHSIQTRRFGYASIASILPADVSSASYPFHPHRSLHLRDHDAFRLVDPDVYDVIDSKKTETAFERKRRATFSHLAWGSMRLRITMLPAACGQRKSPGRAGLFLS